MNRLKGSQNGWSTGGDFAITMIAMNIKFMLALMHEKSC